MSSIFSFLLKKSPSKVIFDFLRYKYTDLDLFSMISNDSHPQPFTNGQTSSSYPVPLVTLVTPKLPFPNLFIQCRLGERNDQQTANDLDLGGKTWSKKGLPWEPTTFIFRGYNPYFEGPKTSHFSWFWGPMVVGGWTDPSETYAQVK